MKGRDLSKGKGNGTRVSCVVWQLDWKPAAARQRSYHAKLSKFVVRS